jgi:undecaprenyl-diphosphatase
MSLFTIQPTRIDHAVADAVVAHTNARTERLAEMLTWGGDEHVLCAVALTWWLVSHLSRSNSRQASDHVLLTTIASSILPHLFKKTFDQTRPDRLTALGHLHGVPISGRGRDAFPSGHAVHIGALASAATVLPSRVRTAVWAVAAALVTTRIALLAHWTTDVIAGLAVGALVERFMRKLTGFPKSLE